MIIQYLKDVVNDHKTPMKLRVHSHNKVIDDKTQFGEWKIQLTMQINFISSLDSRETRTIRSKRDNIEIMVVSETDDIIKELIDSLLQRYQEWLKESTKGSEFKFNSVDLMSYHLQKTSLRRSGSYIYSPRWSRNKRATINRKNIKGDNCFQYASTVALNYNETANHPERISNIKPFIDQYNWEKNRFSIVFKRLEKVWTKQ